MYIYIHIATYACIYTNTYTYTSPCTYTYTYTFKPTHTYTCAYTRKRRYKYTSHVSIHEHVHIHTYIYVYMSEPVLWGGPGTPTNHPVRHEEPEAQKHPASGLHFSAYSRGRQALIRNFASVYLLGVFINQGSIFWGPYMMDPIVGGPLSSASYEPGSKTLEGLERTLIEGLYTKLYLRSFEAGPYRDLEPKHVEPTQGTMGPFRGYSGAYGRPSLPTRPYWDA